MYSSTAVTKPAPARARQLPRRIQFLLDSLRELEANLAAVRFDRLSTASEGHIAAHGYPPAAGAAGEATAWGPPDPGYKLRLTQLLDGGGLGEIHPLHEGENVIGREAGDVVFPADRYVSARHARLLVKGEVVTLEDVGSSNGTFVRVTGRARLAAGDQLLVGAQLLRVEA